MQYARGEVQKRYDCERAVEGGSGPLKCVGCPRWAAELARGTYERARESWWRRRDTHDEQGVACQTHMEGD